MLEVDYGGLEVGIYALSRGHAHRPILRAESDAGPIKFFFLLIKTFINLLFNF